jgi:SET domain-containing protein
MAIPRQSWVNPKIQIKTSTLGGRGMFAVRPITQGEKVLIWGGEYVGKREAEQAAHSGKLVMQWDEDLFSIEDRGDDDAYYINHSCDPNVWMGDVNTLIARRDVSAGEELTADYALWEAREDHVSKWNCSCGARNCRAKVTGRDWMLPELQAAYTTHFSPLLNNRISKNPAI